MRPGLGLALLALGLTTPSSAQDRQPQPQNATAAVLRAFDHHDIVMFGEAHGCKQEYAWLRELVGTPEFADHVDDIVLEFGNSLYQKVVDRYIAGEDIPLAQVRPAWRNVVGAPGPPSPVYELFYQAVRETNLKRRGKHQMRILLGGPPADWDAIKDRKDLDPFMKSRDSCYARVVKEEVLDKKRRAFLIMGTLHFRRLPPGVVAGLSGPGPVEKQLLAAGANTYLIVFGTNVTGGYDDLDKRFNAWPRPAIVDLRGNWVGDLPFDPVVSGGMRVSTVQKFGDAADALLYVAPRDSLTALMMPRAELEGTAYGKELDRRSLIQFGQIRDYLRDRPTGDAPEHPLYKRPG